MSGKKPGGHEPADDRKGIHRGIIGLNVAVQILLLLAVLAAINMFSFSNYRRIDISHEDSFRLAPQTRAFLRDLREEVTVHLLMQKGNPLAGDIANLLREFRDAARQKLKIREISPYADFSQAVELQKRFKFGFRENLVIVESGSRHLVLSMTDLADFDMSGVELGARPTLKTFNGEAAIAGAILGVTTGQTKTVYYVTGHGEPGLDLENGIGEVVAHWERQQIRVGPIELRSVGEIPADASAVVLAGPRFDLTDHEITVLKGYLARRGRLMVFLSWGVLTPNLDLFLSGLGVTPRADRVLATKGSSPVVSLFRDVIALPEGDHAVTRRLGGINVLVRGATQSLALEKPSSGARLAAKPLLVAQEGYWGETDQAGLDAGKAPVFDAATDAAAPVVVAAAVEPTEGSGDSDRARARLVVIGSSSCIDPDGITEGVLDFTTSSLNWLVDREKLAGVGPKPPRGFALNLPDSRIRAVALIVLGVIPGLSLILGIVLWTMRRR